MNLNQSILAKAVDLEERSDSIVVSFNSIWLGPLQKREFSAVIRKRIPKAFEPRWLYFHINAPTSAICARAEIVSVKDLTLPAVLSISKKLALSENQIRQYVGREATIGCYHLGEIEFSKRQIVVKEISDHMVYHPPQSFVILSIDAKEILDNLCGFSKLPARDLRNG